MKIPAAALAIMLTSTSAYAADLAPQPVEPVAPMISSFSWSGFHAGVQAGYTWGKSDYSNYRIQDSLWDYRGKIDARYGEIQITPRMCTALNCIVINVTLNADE